MSNRVVFIEFSENIAFLESINGEVGSKKNFFIEMIPAQAQ